MPVTGENAVVHRTAIKREAHVRAAIVNRISFPRMGKEGNRVAVQTHNRTARVLHLVQLGSKNEIVLSCLRRCCRSSPIGRWGTRHSGCHSCSHLSLFSRCSPVSTAGPRHGTTPQWL